MEARFFDNLPADIKALVTEIEDYAKKSIQIGPTERPTPSCVISQFEARILFPDVNAIECVAMAHELLHIQRNWPQKVPQLFAKRRDSEPHVQAAGDLDNALEHLVIIPRQKLYAADLSDCWNRRLANRIRVVEPWKTETNEVDRRLNLLRTFLTVEFVVTDPSIKAAMAAVLNAENLEADAATLLREIGPDVSNKERLVSALARQVPQLVSMVQLLLFDPVSEVEIPIPIPP